MSPSVAQHWEGLRQGRDDAGGNSTLWYEIDVLGPIDVVWRVITSPRFVREFYYGLVLDTDWRVGSTIRYLEPDGRACMIGVLEDVVAGERFTARIRYVADERAYEDPPSVVSWRLESARDDHTLVRIEHSGLATSGRTLSILEGGWPWAVVGLAALVKDGSAAVAQAHWPGHRMDTLQRARAVMGATDADDGEEVPGPLP